MKFGNAIKKIRQHKKLTQVDLAKRLKTASSYISAIENGQKEPSLTLIKRIAKALSVPVELLIFDSIDINTKMKAEDKKIVELAKVLVHHYLNQTS
jgi:transcriptional regulator with XRE-family HTH domain